MSNFEDKIEKEEKGIWRYVRLYDKFIEPANRLLLDNQNDGGTRETEVEEINKLLGVNHLYFKREDKNTCGSLKGRSLAYQVSLAKQKGSKSLVISTSGNAGIAAAAYCRKAGIGLYILISPETEEGKVAEMQKYGPVMIKSKRAIRLANYLSVKYEIKNLKPSRDDDSIEGFKSISFEIYEHIGEIDALFTFVTSGSSFVGIGRAYKYLLENDRIKKMPKLYAVQSGNIFSIACEFSEIENDARESDAGKLGVKNTGRKKEVIEFIKSSGGKGVYVGREEIEKVREVLENHGIITSAEGCASLAAAIKESKENKFEKAVCILSGKFRSGGGRVDESKIYKAESFGEVDEIINQKSNIKNQKDRSKFKTGNKF